MNISINSEIIKRLSIIYFAIAFIFLINEFLKFHPILDYFGLLRLFVLASLYLYSTQKINPIYLGVLAFIVLSNFLFMKETENYLFYGMIAYLINRLLTVILVFRTIKIKNPMAITVATIPFLFFYLYVISLAENSLLMGFLSLLFNALLMSLFGGLSLSNYYFNSENKNMLLLISCLLFMMQNFVFFLQKYYFLNGFFEPISIALNTIALYVFYKFVILSEESNMELQH